MCMLSMGRYVHVYVVSIERYVCMFSMGRYVHVYVEYREIIKGYNSVKIKETSCTDWEGKMRFIYIITQYANIGLFHFYFLTCPWWS